MNLKAGSWVADVGGGDGDYSVRMSHILKDSGADIDQDKLEELHEELEERNIEMYQLFTACPVIPCYRSIR